MELKEKYNSLTNKSSVQELQEYVKQMIITRGFQDEDIKDLMILLTEETGELAKAIRKTSVFLLFKVAFLSSVRKGISFFDRASFSVTFFILISGISLRSFITGLLSLINANVIDKTANITEGNITRSKSRIKFIWMLISGSIPSSFCFS